MTPDTFIAKLKANALKDRSAAQSHFNDLCSWYSASFVMRVAARDYLNTIKTLGAFENLVFENVSRIFRRALETLASDLVCPGLRQDE